MDGFNFSEIFVSEISQRCESVSIASSDTLPFARFKNNNNERVSDAVNVDLLLQSQKVGSLPEIVQHLIRPAKRDSTRFVTQQSTDQYTKSDLQAFTIGG